MGVVETARRYRATIVAAIIVAVIIAISLALFSPRASDAKLAAYVHDGDGSVTVLALDTPQSLVIETSLGRNTVVVEDGAVRVTEADCPGHDCMRQHAISAPGQQVICLPHRLWIEIRSEGDDDGKMDESRVTWEEGAENVDVIVR